ncbi:hypothetical protein K450DRAFT_225582 [Umbelopsis ramanniana AG]|uniref:2'-phosphotransferase n=1 Tax=Umbelopsis ramanniana AG TaxID=1314678 RepID=A0AAD5EFJ3_UMBRA|nr:uncharacterized protein K450DRAFT_225582 [Umbelopsis ramanniana AG]KAI8582943.1 hypothetical protein K450DRAFT_225582 [Umbelopsis ramanniana AG]
MSEDVVIPRLDDRQKVHLSKALSYILRHGATKEKLVMTDDGFIQVQEIQDEDGCWWIRANQGHSLKAIKVELDLIKEPLPICVHGTYTTNWNSIATQGLKRMSRNHIHFAAGMPGEHGVISGMRKSCDVFIYVDMVKAMEDGIVFQLSANQVILSEGINGVLDPTYFLKVVDREGKPLLIHQPIVT